MLALAFVAMFASAPGQSFLLAVFLDEMLEGTGLSRTAFATLYAAATVVSAAVMAGLGRAADRFGLRVIWLVVCLALAGACGLASLASGLVLAFAALALLRTFGQGSFPLLGTLIVARTFHGRRGRAMAVASFGITAASTVLPPLVVALILAFGWRTSFQLLGLALVALVLPLAALIRTERDAGGGAAAGDPAADEAFPPALRRSRRLRLEVPTTSAARLLFVLSAPPLVMTAIIFHAVSLLGERGLSLGEAGAALSALGLASAAGTVAAGAVSDRISTRLLVSGMSVLLVGSAALLLVPGATAGYLAFVLLGLSGGAFGVATGLVWARTYGLREIGRLQGTSFSVQIAAAAAGPLPLALSLGASGSYAPALVGLLVYGALALVAALGWREPGAAIPTGPAGAHGLPVVEMDMDAYDPYED